MINEAVAEWAVREVSAQHDGIEDVEPLYNAYLWFSEIYDGTLTPAILVQLGNRVKPGVNWIRGFRPSNVSILGGSHQPPDWRDVPRLIERLCESWNEGLIYSNLGSAVSLFIEFEKIHPYLDGNGRAGAILANVVEAVPEDKLALSWEIFSFREGRSLWKEDGDGEP